jgi:sugar phosphate isomerase/epimerase
MLRRQFLAAMAAAPLFGARNKIDRSRLSAISDEVAKTPAEAFTFAEKYRLQWLELRDVPGAKVHYSHLSETELKAAAKEFQDHGVRISFLNTGYFKFALPGTEPVRRKPETSDARDKRLAREKADFDRRTEDVKQGIHAAQILGVDKMRVFTFSRVEDPSKVEQRVADVLGELALIAEKEKVKLLVENEASCNVGTSAELASLLKLIPNKNVGFNWDPQNALSLKEVPFPNGYDLLPKKRMWNAQAKGKGLLDEQQRLDWAAIIHTLEKDNYLGEVGLETHYFDGTNMEKAQLSMQELVRIVEST